MEVDIQQYLQKGMRNVLAPGESYTIAKHIVEDLFSNKRMREYSSALMTRLDEIVRRVKNAEPLQYITGVAHFYGYQFMVNPDVLIPRPETEELVEWILEDIQELNYSNVLDVGVGSGCISITLKKKYEQLQLFAADKSKEAIKVAQYNAMKLGANVEFLQLDFLDETVWPALPPIEVIVSNPPYISKNDVQKMDKSVTLFEPADALFPPGGDFLIFYKALAKFFAISANAKLMYLEINEFYVQEILNIFRDFTFTLRKDLQGLERMIKVEK